MNISNLVLRMFCYCILLWNIAVNQASAQSLPTQTSTLFSGSGNCATCHAPGFPNTNALKGPNGEDISPVTLWRSTMMANAAKDPFWQAKVTAEVAANPHLQSIIEDKCTTCHAPLGRTEAVFNGAAAYSLQQAQADPLARDGVSCTACHQIKNVNLGAQESFSGKYVIENDRIIYGPFQNPFTQPMRMFVNYTPTFSAHVHKSELCATCHTLFTPYVDNNGNIVGEAPEQVPYLEWKNSDYPTKNIQCQTCHMPESGNAVVIANFPMMLSARSPFAKHYFVGANVFMLRLLKKHGAEIGVTATAAQFDSTIARTLRILQKETAKLSVNYRWRNDSLEVKIAVANKSGHKFPTAYPSRRAWIYLQVRNLNEQSVFQSGAWEAQTGEINGLDSPYEPHHDVITSEGQVQVYEPVMKDVDGNVNYTLLRAAGYLKDNRLPPAGFTTAHPDYQFAAIEGQAAQDDNFNRSGATQGTGTDTLTFRIGGLNAALSHNVEIKLLYQSLAPRFAENLFQYNTAEVRKFKGYYAQADKSPVTIDSMKLVVTTTGIQEQAPRVPDSPFLVRIYPNPFNPATTIRLQLHRAGQIEITIYNLLGEKVFARENKLMQAGVHEIRWDGKSQDGQLMPGGEYLVRAKFVEENSKFVHTRSTKILLLR